ncbi:MULTISPECIES: SDR family NAD(P)-dependent oxidoreductase [Actinomadura]|uniref:SDR family NAD(P)-dependent oxidoreductase n=1 Tax=Actinomadura TaxID=1988 RepID=UPI0003AD4B26|nr:SDR family oxidoreductase [Actinomadura madurae]SPT64007.1 3-oxoacyl-[acyl-carrier-protein] reductase FabG [Actinomadura madurae]
MRGDGRVALVTGASRGIGRSIALTMAESGWHVVATGRDREGLAATAAQIVAAGGHADVHTVDVSNEASVRGLVAALADDGAHPVALVNNSGVGGPSMPLWEIEPDAWDEAFAVNVRGVYLLCRAVLPLMIERGTGSVVNVGSVTAKNPLAHRTPYAASKAALIGLTRTLALDAGPHGIRVNLVSPGAVTGERFDWVVSSQAQATGRSEEEVRAAFAGQAALRRNANADEVARAVEFLASGRASGITGIDLTVAAGYVMN